MPWRARADMGSIADELEASSHIHPANDPTSHLYPSHWPLSGPSVGHESIGSEIAGELGQAQHATEEIWAFRHSSNSSEAMGESAGGVDGRAMAAVALVLATVVVLGAVAAASRIGWRVYTDKETRGRRARRLRGVLVLALMLADMVIACVHLFLFRDASVKEMSVTACKCTTVIDERKGCVTDHQGSASSHPQSNHSLLTFHPHHARLPAFYSPLDYGGNTPFLSLSRCSLCSRSDIHFPRHSGSSLVIHWRSYRRCSVSVPRRDCCGMAYTDSQARVMRFWMKVQAQSLEAAWSTTMAQGAT